MNRLRLVLVLGLLGAIPMMAFAQSASSDAPSSAVTPIGPWFVSAEKEKAPDSQDLANNALIAVNKCPGKAVVCEPLASGDREDTQWNRVYAERRLNACLAAVTDAGGAASASGGYRVGPSGEHGRGVELRCASISVPDSFRTLPESQRPITTETLPVAFHRVETTPSHLGWGIAGFGSLGTGDGVNLYGGLLTGGWTQDHFVLRTALGAASSDHGAGGVASFMAGGRLTDWLDITAGPVAHASWVDGMTWTSQYNVGLGLGVGLSWKILRLQVTPQYGPEVDRFQHQGADWRFRFDGSLGLEFWY